MNSSILLQRKIPQNMSGKYYAKKMFKSFDLFSTSQLLRFDKDGEYKTVSGGMCSLIVIVVFLALFMSTAIQTINKQIIVWSSSNTHEFAPSQTSININPPNDPFMFAVKLLGINLNDNFRFFDVFLVERTYLTGTHQGTPKYVDLVPCTSQHFSITDDIRQSTQKLDMHTWLCPPIGYNFNIKGKFSSTEMKLLQIRLTKCNASKDPLRPCASDALIDTYEKAFEQFVFGVSFVNPLINQGDQNYLSYYLEDRNYIRFTRKLGADSNGRIEDYEIQTDVSLSPFAQNVVDSGVIICEVFQTIVFEVTNDRYASFSFMKSARSTTYTRSFNKLDSFFSYIGGLVGTILGLMFIVASFTSMAYQLELAQRICCYAEDIINDFATFNLFSYCLFIFYKIGKIFGIGRRFKGMRQVDQCSQQASRQLDVQLLLERILFLERATETLLEDHQLEGLHMHRLDTLKDIKKRRKRYTLRHGKQEDSDSDEQLQTKSQNQNNTTNIADPNLSNSKAQIRPLQDSQVAKVQKPPKRNLLSPLDKNSLIIKQLHEQTLRGNKISKRILEGIEQQKVGVSLPDLNKIVNVSSEVIHLRQRYSLEFQLNT